jgi:hypothetical protein
VDPGHVSLKFEPMYPNGFQILDAQNLGYLYPQSLQLRELSFPAVPKEVLIPETFVDKNNVEGYRRKK